MTPYHRIHEMLRRVAKLEELFARREAAQRGASVRSAKDLNTQTETVLLRELRLARDAGLVQRAVRPLPSLKASNRCLLRPWSSVIR